jgi:hypothetical protein
MTTRQQYIALGVLVLALLGGARLDNGPVQDQRQDVSPANAWPESLSVAKDSVADAMTITAPKCWEDEALVQLVGTNRFECVPYDDMTTGFRPPR